MVYLQFYIIGKTIRFTGRVKDDTRFKILYTRDDGAIVETTMSSKDGALCLPDIRTNFHSFDNLTLLRMDDYNNIVEKIPMLSERLGIITKEDFEIRGGIGNQVLSKDKVDPADYLPKQDPKQISKVFKLGERMTQNEVDEMVSLNQSWDGYRSGDRTQYGFDGNIKI